MKPKQRSSKHCTDNIHRHCCMLLIEGENELLRKENAEIKKFVVIIKEKT